MEAVAELLLLLTSWRLLASWEMLLLLLGDGDGDLDGVTAVLLVLLEVDDVDVLVDDLELVDDLDGVEAVVLVVVDDDDDAAGVARRDNSSKIILRCLGYFATCLRGEIFRPKIFR